MDKHLLSKSTFIRAVQCMKALYLHKHHYDLRTPLSPERLAIFSRGADVGVLARELFPGGIDAAPNHYAKLAEAVKKTKEFMEGGAEVIYEAAFQHEQVLVLLDILVKQDGKWFGYEVKSSVKISPTYVLDASLQHYVISNSGTALEDFSLIHMNNRYVRKGKLEVDKLFSIVSVLKQAKKNEKLIREKINEAKKTLTDAKIPEIQIGTHCFSPYECDFITHCWKHVPRYSVFDLGGMTKEEQFELYNSGVEKISDVKNLNTFSENIRMQVESFTKNKIFVNKKGVQDFLGTLTYPLYFMDFETFMPAVPMFDNTKPYQHIPFQYSLHILEHESAACKHFEFLAETGSDPRKSFLENLLRDTKGEGDIVAYNASFETAVLNKLKDEFPECTAEIEQRILRMKDLMKPFRDKHFYHPKMFGSYSIKTVLPALVPELKYDKLKIMGGAGAMSAFENLQTETDMFKIAELREALLTYCKMDTWAMVKIMEVLRKI